MSTLQLPNPPLRARCSRAWRVLATALTWVWLGSVGVFADGASDHWAYQPIRAPRLPGIHNIAWPSSPLDRFVLARLEAADLAPSPEADRATLCRRLYFDLTGLPPTPEEIDAFLADSRPEALPELVDRLLASPRFGEHWARHWFDVVRFAESVTLRGFLFKEAWRYRDYVIDAFNDDRPIDEFFLEQLAGDLLPADGIEARQRRWIATTFLMLGNTNLEEQDKKQLEMDVVDEQLDVIGKAFLGQTVSCARCHDHKFDPIPTRDYYALAGILKNSLAIRHDNVSAWVEQPLPLEAELEQVHRRREADIAALRAEIKEARQNATNEVKALEARLKERIASGPSRPMVMAPRESTNAVDVAIHRRGSVHRLSEVVPRGFLSVATPPGVPQPGPEQSGRRELAEWINHPDNPLTRRVFVNRVWLWLMGQGLVRTPDNFGTTGTPPSHPELLDWLASAFAGFPESERQAGGSSLAPDLAPAGGTAIRPWSLKSLIREIALSRTYRLQSAPTDRARAIDPANHLLSHATSRRLTAEQLRDAMLAVSGRLRVDPPSGPTYPADRSADYGFVAVEPWRSVYLPVFRNALPEVFNLFDFPPTSLTTGQRSESTVATQALFLLNDPFVRGEADAAQRRIRQRTHGASGESDAQAGIDRSIFVAHRAALGRFPSPGEARALRQHLAAATDAETAWTDVMHALLASADFRLLN